MAFFAAHGLHGFSIIFFFIMPGAQGLQGLPIMPFFMPAAHGFSIIFPFIMPGAQGLHGLPIIGLCAAQGLQGLPIIFFFAGIDGYTGRTFLIRIILYGCPYTCFQLAGKTSHLPVSESNKGIPAMMGEKKERGHQRGI